MERNIKALAQAQREYAIKLRRDFHQHPEIAGEEVWTSARICEELEKMGIPYERVNALNVVGRIDTGKPGQRLAIRADIDALPMQELNECEYRSRIDGRMHACGHDAHAAILLGTAKAMMEAKDELTGVIYLCFQIGEEVGIGAKEVVEYLQQQGGVDHVIGLHIFAQMPTGYIAVANREVCAGAMSWELVIHGKGGHGSQPHTAVDPIKPLCDILPRYVSLAVNRVDPFETFVVSPCMIQAGTAGNIIPDTARVVGSVRFYSKEVVQSVREMMERIAVDICHSYGAEAEFIVPKEPLIAVLNDPETAAIGQQAAREAGMELVFPKPAMGSDNFALFTDAFPGFYAMLGAGDPARGINMPNHNPRFDVDEEALPLGIEFFLRTAEKLLK